MSEMRYKPINNSHRACGDITWWRETYSAPIRTYTSGSGILFIGGAFGSFFVFLDSSRSFLGFFFCKTSYFFTTDVFKLYIVSSLFVYVTVAVMFYQCCMFSASAQVLYLDIQCYTNNHYNIKTCKRAHSLVGTTYNGHRKHSPEYS